MLLYCRELLENKKVRKKKENIGHLNVETRLHYIAMNFTWFVIDESHLEFITQKNSNLCF